MDNLINKIKNKSKVKKSEKEQSITAQNLLKEWQDKYSESYDKYSVNITEINDNRDAYEGTRKIRSSDGKTSNDQSSNVRKVCFELVETQVDSNIPLPKVGSEEGYEEQAMTIEMFLKNKIDQLPIEELNDEQGRSTPTDGGSIFFLEWDNTRNTHNTFGDINIRNIDSRQVIPQSGVYRLEDMDYVFIVFKQTRLSIKQKYNVSVEDEDGDASINEDLLEHVFCFYKNEDGTIGLYSYVGDTMIQDYENYFARQIEVCTKCGKDKNPLEDICECGNDKFKLVTKEKETIEIMKPEVNPMTGETRNVPIEIEVPYYIPKFFPIVIRKNVARNNMFLGASDITYIKDQQNDLAIYGAKIKEKILKGGSIVTMPKGLHFKATNDELKIMELDNPQQLAMINVLNLQPDISKDLNMLDQNYTIARQTIGITDSFQGRQDKTATSGVAKEIAAAQAAGRLVSKRTMKDSSFTKLYEYMFKFILAYADEPRNYGELDAEGKMSYKVFDKRDFILQDKSGNYYYNDEFVFSTDASSTLSNNRESMWQETRMNFTSGAYGEPQDIGTLIMFWNMMNYLHYPGARQALSYLEVRKQEQELQRQQEMIAKEIATQNTESIMTDNKMKQIELQNQNKQLQQQNKQTE